MNEPTSGLSMMKPRTEKPAPEKSESAEGEYPKVTPPAGYTPPDDAQVGDTFDATVKMRIEENGEYCILTMDGVPYKEDDDNEEEEEGAAQPTLSEAASAQRSVPGYASM